MIPHQDTINNILREETDSEVEWLLELLMDLCIELRFLGVSEETALMQKTRELILQLQVCSG